MLRDRIGNEIQAGDEIFYRTSNSTSVKKVERLTPSEQWLEQNIQRM